MTRVVVSTLKLGNAKSVKTKRIRSVHGSTLIRVIDAESPTLASDLTYVFRANVIRARADNAALEAAPTKKRKNRRNNARGSKRRTPAK